MRLLVAILMLTGCASVTVETAPQEAAGASGGAVALDAGADAPTDAPCLAPWDCCGAADPLCLGACCETVDDAGQGHLCGGNAENGICCADTCVATP